MFRIPNLSAGCVLGCGLALFAPLHASAADSVVYSFTGGSDGGRPVAGLIKDNQNNLYGTTTIGGANGAGTVFEIAANGAETVLHSFGSGGDGEAPDAGVIEGSAGNFYGTTSVGGAHGFGTVFMLAANHTTESVLYSFTGGTDGGIPVAGLVMDSAGSLYGTASYGGAQNRPAPWRSAPCRKPRVPTETGEWRIVVLVDGTDVDGGPWQGPVPLDNIYLVGNWQGAYAVTKGSHTVTFQIYSQASLQLDQWSDTVTITTP
jgi:uncharacterized repeat protein (TIGR03803 family)